MEYKISFTIDCPDDAYTDIIEDYIMTLNHTKPVKIYDIHTEELTN